MEKNDIFDNIYNLRSLHNEYNPANYTNYVKKRVQSYYQDPSKYKKLICDFQMV